MKAFLSVIALFLVFSIVAVGTYFYAKKKYDVGQGLTEKTKREIIVHYYVVVDRTLPLNAYPEIPAEKISLDSSVRARLKIKNMTKGMMKAYLGVSVKPKSALQAIDMNLKDKKFIQLGPEEVKNFILDYSVNPELLSTKDGTVSFTFEFQSAKL